MSEATGANKLRRDRGDIMILSDFLVIGGGIIGINVARELKNLFPDTRVILIEKEKECGAHASTRNSGVLHGGFYYSSTVDGKTKIGPTAIPALWRENYHGFDRFDFRELVDIFTREVCLFASSDFDFKKLALEEIKKYSRSRMVFLASSLVKGVKTENYKRWGIPGIRAQLVDTKAQKLEMDFVIEGDDKLIHILNAVSPAFTCSIPFSEYVCEEIQSRREK